MKIGYIGLGKMGKNMVLRLLENNIEIVAWNRSPDPVEEVKAAGAIGAISVSDLVASLSGPKIIWLMLTAGAPTDEIIDELLPLLSPGDLVVDGANSNYNDTLRRAEKFKNAGVRFMDIGVSGGPGGARNGACLMIGGDENDVQELLPVIVAASAPKAFEHLGPVGAGHFSKMVHNGIEYGMMQAIGEGAAVLKGAPFTLNLEKVFMIYNNRSVIESRLVQWAKEALADDPDLDHISSVIKASGEGKWTVQAAEKIGVDVPIIDKSLKIREESTAVEPTSLNGYRNKMVSALRGKFGQHDVKA